MKRLLFICTGNICRSPMAEGFARAMGKQRKLDIEAASAGIGAYGGQAPSPHGVSAMKELGIDIAGLRSKPATSDLVQKADLILVMTYGHLDTMLMLYPSAADKIYLLRDFEAESAAADREIDDPIGMSQDTYRRCRDQIKQAVESVFDMLQKEAAAKAALPAARKRRLLLAADHTGCQMKNKLAVALKDHSDLTVEDLGTNGIQAVDYPDFAEQVARAILSGKADLGILVGRTGIGMAMAANKFPGIRAALVHNVETARLSREHNDANILCLSATELSAVEAHEIVSVWLRAEFAGGRHQRRIEKMDTLHTAAAPSSASPSLASADPEVFAAITHEKERQTHNIELIASENFTSKAVMEAQGSCLTNKYAEGYPGKRWYGGCENVDVIEQLAIDRVKQLFGAEHANVQPHSGSQANMAVYFSVLKPGDRILTMDLSHGGHLTHGHKMNFSGKLFEVLHYGVRKDTETIDYDALEKQAEEFKPNMITVGASAYSRIIDFERMGKIARKVGAFLFADIAHIAGLVAAGVHPSPIGHADFVTSTTHKTLRGPRGGVILCKSQYAKEIDANLFPGIQGGPLMHVIAGKAVCFGEALQPSFKAYQQQVARNAKALCEGMKKNGYRIVSGTTENHVMLVDLQPMGFTGKDASDALDHAGITVNKNAIPFDTQSPFKAGGIRLGSPAVTSRGMKEDEMFDIANWIHAALSNRENPAKLAAIRDEVKAFTAQYPLPG